MIKFHLPIVPPKATSQSAGKRIRVIPPKFQGDKFRVHLFKNDAAKSAEHDLSTLCAKYKPRVPLDGPVRLRIDFVWPWRKTELKRNIAKGMIPHTSKPDCSNAVKLVEDVLTKSGFFKDDSQVSSLKVTKAWGETPGITITINKIEDESLQRQ